MQFHESAPKALCDYYDNLSGCTGTEKDLLERLLTDRDMELVWSAYRESFPQQNPDLSTVGPELFNHVLSAYNACMKRPPPTSERIEKLEEIAKKAKSLAYAIKNTEFDTDPLLYLDLSDKEKLRRLEDKAGVLDYQLTVRTLLERIKKQAKDRAKAIKQDSHLRYVPNPGGENALVNYFIRAMSEILETHLGSARPRLLARLARVVLDDPKIDESTVRTSLRKWGKDSEALLKTLSDKL